MKTRIAVLILMIAVISGCASTFRPLCYQRIMEVEDIPGDCKRKAILVKKAADQAGDDCSIVCGFAGAQDDYEGHCWNVFYKDGKDYLVDASDPWNDDFWEAKYFPEYQDILQTNRVVTPSELEHEQPDKWTQLPDEAISNLPHGRINVSNSEGRI